MKEQFDLLRERQKERENDFAVIAEPSSKIVLALLHNLST
jgi:hypothetical protein